MLPEGPSDGGVARHDKRLRANVLQVGGSPVRLVCDASIDAAFFSCGRVRNL